MAVSLYDATVVSFIQGLGALQGVLKVGLDHCASTGADPEAMLDVRLYPDMAPLSYQIYASTSHSLDAIKATKSGVFAPPRGAGPLPYAAWQQKVADTRAALQAFTAEEINELEGNDVVFDLGERKLPFTGADFLMSFSVPNFYFHMTTAYDILRMKGAPLAKQHFLGRIRMKA
jgi:hypothetical protein